MQKNKQELANQWTRERTFKINSRLSLHQWIALIMSKLLDFEMFASSSKAWCSFQFLLLPPLALVTDISLHSLHFNPIPMILAPKCLNQLHFLLCPYNFRNLRPSYYVLDCMPSFLRSPYFRTTPLPFPCYYPPIFPMSKASIPSGIISSKHFQHLMVSTFTTLLLLLNIF